MTLTILVVGYLFILTAIIVALLIKKDDEPKYPNWMIMHNALGEQFTVCKSCDTAFYYINKQGSYVAMDLSNVSHCPNCGADMRKDEGRNA